MNGAYLELALGPLRQMRRSLLGWGIGLGALVAVTVAFWPAFRGSSGISEAIDQLPSGVIDAFGLAGFGTPAGFLRGNLYEFIVPLLLAIAAVAAANGVHGGRGGRRAVGDVPQPACLAPVCLHRSNGRTDRLARDPDVVRLGRPARQRRRRRIGDRRDAGRLDRGPLRLARAPVRRICPGGRGMAATAFPRARYRGRRGCRRLPRLRAVRLERSAQALERPVALEVGSRQ